MENLFSLYFDLNYHRFDIVEGTTVPDLQPFGESIWIVDGPEVRDFGILFTSRMAVVKLSDGSLWVDSPVYVPSETLEHITALGPVRYLVAATPRHFWRLDAWHRLFPEAELWTAKITPFTLGMKKDLPLTGRLGESSPGAWADDLDQLAFNGNPLIEEVFFLHKRSGTLIVDDLIQNHLAIKRKPIRNALFRLARVAYPHGGVPLDVRLSFTNRKVARRSLEKLLSWNFDKLIIGHGPCLEKDAKPFVEQAFRWLGRGQANV